MTAEEIIIFIPMIIFFIAQMYSFFYIKRCKEENYSLSIENSQLRRSLEEQKSRNTVGNKINTEKINKREGRKNEVR